jgi:hypothetical protein
VSIDITPSFGSALPPFVSRGPFPFAFEYHLRKVNQVHRGRLVLLVTPLFRVEDDADGAYLDLIGPTGFRATLRRLLPNNANLYGSEEISTRELGPDATDVDLIAFLESLWKKEE